MKYLIVCSDGTWNTPDQEDNGIPTPTNVVKLKSCLAASATVDGAAVEQRVYYHTGVGTEGGLLSRTAGGAWGQGLSKNIQSAYYWLASSYTANDRIFLFGFSRGAYTVRSLCGMLSLCGLLDLTGVATAEGWRRVEETYQQGYREGRPQAQWAADWAFHHRQGTPVYFIGVWDTVGALGVPDDLAILNLFDSRESWRFHNTSLGKNVTIARHALALDELRASFTPTLWTEAPAGTDMLQLWFPGVHGDVGGGYVETGLSDAALKWMIDEARKAGLAFDPAMTGQIRPEPLGTLHDSMKGIFKTQRSRPRNTPSILSSPDQVHPAALMRHRTPPISQAPYRPTRVLKPGDSATMDVFAREHWNATGLWLEPGEYRCSGHGEWLDGSVPSGPNGSDDGELHLGELAQLLGSALGWIERGWQAVTGNQTADLKMTRRHEQWEWFALIGAVANSDRAPNTDGTPPMHQAFKIGDQSTLTLEHPGYLYAYANDAWDFYANNRGSIQLTVERLT
jgi:T6SS, Phospholipase effector Tle1-like, catalytic domain